MDFFSNKTPEKITTWGIKCFTTVSHSDHEIWIKTTSERVSLTLLYVQAKNLSPDRQTLNQPVFCFYMLFGVGSLREIDSFYQIL